MDVITYALCKKLISSVSSGISGYEIDGLTLKITTNDGQVLEMTFPEPADGKSIDDVKIDSSNHLICTMSDGAEIDAGEIKTIKGPKGDPGESGVYLGEEEPTDPEVKVWIDPTGDGGVAAHEVAFADGEDLQTKYDNGEFAGGDGATGTIDAYTKKQVDDKLAVKVDQKVIGTNGSSEFQNLQDGGQLLFLTNDGKRANISVNDGSHGIYVQLGAMDRDTNTGARVTLGLNKAYYTVGDTYKVSENDEIVNKSALEYETRDLFQGLSRKLYDDGGDPETSSQTIVEIKNRQGSTETIMEIDNLDIETSVPVNAVLGALKGQDLDDRVVALEKEVIPTLTMKASMTKDERTNHQYPQLELSQEQIKTIINHDATLLKVTYNISDPVKGTETDTMVFYTTIDDNTVVDGDNNVRKIKVNAVRTNYEGTIVYHAELLGSGDTFATSIDLQATYVPFNIG